MHKKACVNINSGEIISRKQTMQRKLENSSSGLNETFIKSAALSKPSKNFVKSTVM